MDNIKRCTKCILPETMPFIEFDENGVCNYCKSYKPMAFRPLRELRDIANRIRRDDGREDCIVMFSGGRDSSFLLHYVVKELGLHPLVFTYDWGMSTPVGEENAKKMCEILGVERIVINKDAKKKIENVRKNVKAWCKMPNLGMIPLFTAGDKQFFVEVNKISRERNISTVFIGTNPLEKTDFKTGFCGVSPNFRAEQIHHLTKLGKIQMVRFYLKQFIINPSYINSSLWDTMKAFFSFYDVKQEQVDLYHYVRWNEDMVNDVLINQYGWMLDNETPSTWRIGDGTAAFYNYVYYNSVGFTENDTLRSNQIREGDITREEALRKVKEENKPRSNSIEWYFDRLGFDKSVALSAVEKIRKA